MVAITSLILLSYALSLKACGTIYFIAFTNIESCVDDFAMNVAHSNAIIARKISIKTELMLLIKLHLDCYR